MARKPRNYKPLVADSSAGPVSTAGQSPAELLADGVVDLKTAAKLCGHGLRWIRDRVREKDLPSFQFEQKRVIPRRAVIAFLAERMQAAG